MNPFREILQNDLNLLHKKSKDYAPDNWSRNFDGAAWAMRQFTGLAIKPSHIAMTLFFVKVSRLMSLGEREATNEPLSDTLQDARNYLTIAEALRKEECHGS